MRKVVVHRPGGHRRLTIEEYSDPEPGPGEIGVAVEAVGVGFADCLVRMGLYKSSRDQVGWPVTPGFEVAGRVESLGEGVEDLGVGDRVLAVTRFGGYASRIVVPRSQAFRVPEEISLVQAAAIPVAFLTAYYALLELAHPRGGETLLVHSAAGGVGGALCQLGRRADCRVVGVVGDGRKVEVARRFGAREVIDKSSEELWTAARALAPEGFDIVFDANGVETLAESYRHLASPGKLVVYGFHTMLDRGSQRPNPLKLLWNWWRTPKFDPLRMTNRNRSVLAFNLSYRFDELDLLREVMGDLLSWLREGSIQPPPLQTFPFGEVARAHEALESGRTVGKMVLVPEDRETA